MRKIAPAFVLSAIVAFASGSALALGDKAKEKKSSNTAATQQAGTLSGTGTTASTNPNASTTGTVGAQASGGNVTASAPMTSKRDKCINLKPTDAKWAQFDCGAGDGAAAAGSSAGASAGTGGDAGSGASASGGSSAGGSPSGGSGGPGK